MKWNDNKRLFAFLVLNLFTILLFCHKAKTEAEWTFIAYMHGDNLTPCVAQSIKSMQGVGSTDQVNVLVQFGRRGTQKTWRYKIEKGGPIDAGSLDQEMGADYERDLAACMRWAKNNYPAKHYALVVGPNNDDDVGNKITDKTNKAPMVRDEGVCDTQDLEPIQDKKKIKKNSVVLNAETQKTWSHIQGLAIGMASIKRILGKNLDVLGLNVDLMAKVEVAYQIKDSVDYLVASESAQQGFGWDYAGFMVPLVAQPILFAPDVLAQSIVVANSDYYKNASKNGTDNDFMLSAIDVDKMNFLASSLDAVVEQLEKCKRVDKVVFVSMIKHARKNALEFCSSDYVDLDSFYFALQCKVRQFIANQKISEIRDTKEQIKAINIKIELKKLDEKLVAATKVLDNAVLVNFSDGINKGAQGLSIYYPLSSVHQSYQKMSFVKKTNWCDFLQQKYNF